MTYDGHTLKKRDIAGAMAPALPAAVAGFPVYMYAPELFTSEYGVSIAAIAIILPLLRVTDAITDPALGALSDRFASRRALFTCLSLCVTVIGTLILFLPTETLALLRFSAGVFLATLGYSAVTIQLHIIAASPVRQTQRTRFITAREAFGLVGLLGAVILPYMLREKTSVPTAFFLTACICAVLAFMVMPWFLRAVSRAPQRDAGRPASLSAMWNAVKAMPFPVKQFYGIYALFSLAASLPAVLAVFFINDRLNADAYAGGFLLLYFLAALVCLPFWRMLAGRYGVRNIWAIACFTAVAGFAYAFFLREGDMYPFVAICVISGGAFGAGLVLPAALLAHLLQEHDAQDTAGLYFSLMTLLQKTALALAAAIALPALALAGYDATLEQQPETALAALSFSYALLPCVIQLTAAGWLLRSRRQFGEMYDEISNDPMHPIHGNTDA